jgi:hypothetical protein
MQNQVGNHINQIEVSFNICGFTFFFVNNKFNDKTMDKIISTVKYSQDTKKIPNQAFACCDYLKKVIILDHITSIGFCAFFNCSDLTNIEIPSSVTSIANGAFYNCRSLSQIKIPYNVRLDLDSFTNCNSLTNITISISNNITSNDYIKFFTLISNLKCTGNSTFFIELEVYNHKIPFKSNIHKTTYTNINNSNIVDFFSWSFCNCFDLTKFTIPSKVNIIHDYAFAGCKSLKQISIPDSITSIGIAAFENCSSLTQIEIPNNVTNIGIYVFKDCINLQIIKIPALLFETIKNFNLMNLMPDIIVMVENNSQKNNKENMQKESIFNKVPDAIRRSKETNVPSQNQKTNDKSCIIC